MAEILDPEGRHLPSKLDTASKGEYPPIALSPATLQAQKLAHAAASETARRLGWTRRQFLTSACEIAEAFRERYGYPEMTPALRAKVFGLNAAVPCNISADEIRSSTASDRLTQVKAEYTQNPVP